MKRPLFLTLALLSGCGSETIESQHAQLADLGFDVPAGWHPIDNQRPGVQSSEWQPEENGAKESLTTRSGLVGARVEGDYVPPGTKARYHRVHVVLVEKSGAIVHVLYTARTPDTSLAGLNRAFRTPRSTGQPSAA